MNAVADLCHDNPPVDAARPVRLPGERALALRRPQRDEGVELSATIVDGLNHWAQQLQVPRALATS